MKPLLSFCVMTSAAFMIYIPHAQAYIDPGIAYGLIQAVFAVVFGGAAAWVLRPWTYLKGRFRGKSKSDHTASDDSHVHRSERSS